MEFKTWIEVSFERMETLKALQLPDVFTTEPGAGCIRVVNQSEICSATLHQWNKEQPTLAILPTSRPLVSFNPNVYVVPYSDHSSYQELEDFVSALKPTSLIPIVGNNVPGSLSALVPNRKRHEILVPESVRHYMLRQPESQLSSSAYTSLRRRHLQPLTPKGVVFESPVRPSRNPWEGECLQLDASEEEMDTESSEKDSDSVLIDVSKDLLPNEHKRGAGDMWSFNIVQTVSENMVMAESMPVEILTNSEACLKPVRTARRLFETNAKTVDKTVSDTSQQSRHGSSQNNHALSDSDSMSQHSGHGIDEEDDSMSNDSNTSQHNGHGSDQNDSVTLLSSLNDDFWISTSSLTVLRHEYIVELENRILKNLPFTEEDFKMPCFPLRSFEEEL